MICLYTYIHSIHHTVIYVFVFLGIYQFTCCIIKGMKIYINCQQHASMNGNLFFTVNKGMWLFIRAPKKSQEKYGTSSSVDQFYSKIWKVKSTGKKC